MKCWDGLLNTVGSPWRHSQSVALNRDGQGYLTVLSRAKKAHLSLGAHSITSFAITQLLMNGLGKLRVLLCLQRTHRRPPNGKRLGNRESLRSQHLTEKYRYLPLIPLPSSIGLICCTMLFRTAARQAAPLRRQFAPLARRSVTTDAASAHAENIPQVC